MPFGSLKRWVLITGLALTVVGCAVDQPLEQDAAIRGVVAAETGAHTLVLVPEEKSSAHESQRAGKADGGTPASASLPRQGQASKEGSARNASTDGSSLDVKCEEGGGRKA